MPYADLTREELHEFAPRVARPDDFTEFWARTLDEAAQYDLDPVFEAIDAGLATLDVYDVSFAGYGGHRVHGWLRVPRAATGPLPCVVQYVGYGGGRGLAHENLLWSAAGYAHFIMDTRGQGSGWSVGATGDPGVAGAAHPGYMTRGILDEHDYYYRRLYVDAVRAVDVARSHPAVGEQVAVTGHSQGGGLSLAVSGLRDDLAAVMADVPFLCHFDRAVRIADSGPYLEIAKYLKVHRDHLDQAFRTLSYFDAVNLVQRATAPALFSTALQDATCPPSTVFAAYHAYAGEREIRDYPFNDHEGGQGFHEIEQLQWLAQAW